MKLAARLTAALLVSLGIAWGLSWLPQVSSQADPVFQPGGAGYLTETNLVDALASVPLDLEIASANLQHGVLSVDLFLPKGVSGERFVYHDLYGLCSFSWNSTANVNHLLVRVLQQNAGDRHSKELLLAMEAKRSQWNGELLPADSPVALFKSELEKQGNFSYTPVWMKQN
jgi:hypothetical protein